MAAPVRYRSTGTPPDALVVTAPGVYDLSEEDYHRDPIPGGSLSSTGARKLLPPSCPAIFRYEQDNPPGPKKVFDFGHAAHLKVLGVGPAIHVVDAEDWRTNRAQQERREAYAAGKTPLLRHENDQVEAMAAALRAHPFAGRLFDPERGRAEQSLFWRDPDFGVMRRARLDYLPNPARSRMIISDYKSAYTANPVALEKAIHEHGYHQQAPFYLDGVTALGLAEDPAFVFVFQMKTPPYLVTVVDLDDVAEQVGRDRNRRAIETYARCVAENRWPGYADDVLTLSLPTYAIRAHEQECDR